MSVKHIAALFNALENDTICFSGSHDFKHSSSETSQPVAIIFLKNSSLLLLYLFCNSNLHRATIVVFSLWITHSVFAIVNSVFATVTVFLQ
jgi:hypothetical protein